jgi:hypothetical protein
LPIKSKVPRFATLVGAAGKMRPSAKLAVAAVAGAMLVSALNVVWEDSVADAFGWVREGVLERFTSEPSISTMPTASAAQPVGAIPRMIVYPAVDAPRIEVICSPQPYLTVSFSAPPPGDGAGYWSFVAHLDNPSVWYPSNEPLHYTTREYRSEVYVRDGQKYIVRIVMISTRELSKVRGYLGERDRDGAWWMGYHRPDGAVVLLETEADVHCWPPSGTK